MDKDNNKKFAFFDDNQNGAVRPLIIMMNNLLDGNSELHEGRVWNEEKQDKVVQHFEFDVIKNTPTKK